MCPTAGTLRGRGSPRTSRRLGFSGDGVKLVGSITQGLRSHLFAVHRSVLMSLPLSRQCVVLSGCLFAATFAFSVARSLNGGATATEAAKTFDYSHDFGALRLGETREHVFNVTNEKGGSAGSCSRHDGLPLRDGG